MGYQPRPPGPDAWAPDRAADTEHAATCRTLTEDDRAWLARMADVLPPGWVVDGLPPRGDRGPAVLLVQRSTGRRRWGYLPAGHAPGARPRGAR